tara:strand:- start:399 stop:1025 length:627 start_codon:yes stop_codon:yes gene_type:complete
MKISYSLLTHNETDNLEKLLQFLVEHKDKEDEIVILDDYSTNEKTKTILDGYVSIHNMKFEQRYLKGDFAGQKNALRLMCSGDWIFNIDADELPHKLMFKNLKTILEHNKDIEMFYVPRINTVSGLTQRHVMRWGWQVNDKGYINWPDWQSRLWQNKSHIYWDRSVHETLTGFKNYSFLPQEERFAIQHPKTIEQQEKQNEFYSKIPR